MGKMRDWKNPADYENLKKLTPKGWAWEFLRRNPNYIQEWEKELPLELERTKILLSDPENKDDRSLDGFRKNTPDSTHFRITGTLSGYFKRWGILHLVNPEQDHPFPNPFRGFSSFKYRTIQGGNMSWGEHSFFTPCGESPYVPVVYDMTRPLKPQLTNAQKVLLAHQKYMVNEGKIRINTVKKHKDNWVEYLRILDAKAEKVKNIDIARIMFPNLSNEYPDYQGSQKVRKSLITAKYLAENGYREIAMTF